MKWLSLECSTPQASLVLMEDETCRWTREWEAERARHEHMAEIIDRARRDAGWAWEELEWMVIGRGPGHYAGLRAGLLTVQALAAPGRIPVTALSGIDAAARSRMREKNVPSVLVLGDARRQSLWWGILHADTLDHQPTSWSVIKRESLTAILEGGHPVATPNPELIAACMDVRPGTSILEPALAPHALDNARLAWVRRTLPVEPEPLTPLYLHAAV